jgi:hypothetical protein
MRWGTALLIVGFMLCVSIAWAAIGFIAMALGLICMLTAEEKKKRAIKLKEAAVSERREQDKELRAHLPQVPPSLPPLRYSSSEANDNRPLASSQEIIWEALCSDDPDLARVVAVLTPYGKKYVDELAKAYLVFNDKNYLPLILTKIVVSARQDFDQLGAAQVAANGSVSDLVPYSGVQRSPPKRDRILREVVPAEAKQPEQSMSQIELGPYLIAAQPTPEAVRSRRQDQVNAIGSSAKKLEHIAKQGEAGVSAAETNPASTKITHEDDNLIDLYQRSLGSTDMRPGPGSD